MNEFEGRRYQVLRLLGEGGFGRVYQARMTGAGGFSKEVAIKLLNEGDAPEHVLQRFRDESRILGLVRDRAVISVDPPTRLEGRWAVVMEYVEGVTTAQLVEHGPVPPKVALEIVQECARALDRVYTLPSPSGPPLKLIHRDIKPDNLQITPAGDLKILDFGIARAEFKHREAKTTLNIAGTFGYIAPERMEGEELPAGDIYSLGIVLRVLVTGKPPARRADWATHAHSSPDVLRALALAKQMCAMEPDDRPTAAEVEREASALVAAMPGEPLRYWAREHVPAAMSHREDDFVGQVLTETMSTVATRIDDEAGITRRSTGRIAAAAAFGTFSVAGILGLVFVAIVATAGFTWALTRSGSTVVQIPAPAAITPAEDGVAEAPAAVPDPADDGQIDPADDPTTETPGEADPGSEAPDAPVEEAAPAPAPVAAAPAPRPKPSPRSKPTGATWPITFTSVPMGADVFLDDAPIGQTPLVGFEVPEGDHAVRMVLGSDSGTRSITAGRRGATKYIWRGGEEWQARY